MGQVKNVGWFAAGVDGFQRRHRWVGFPLAVVYKFADDQGSYLASLIAYYGFASLFPLLLILTTVLGFALRDVPGLRQRILDSALTQFPVLGEQLTDSVHPLQGSGMGLVIGVLVALYGGLGFTVALQNAFNTAWAVPMDQRPDALTARARGLAMLVILAVGVLATSGLSALATSRVGAVSGLGVGVRVLGTVLSVLVNCGLFVVVLRVLTARPLTVAQVLPGAVSAALAWQGLQSLGTFLLSHELDRSDRIYGLFGVVLGLLAWLYLQAVMVVLAVEVIVVRARKLWPRALLGPTTLADPDSLTRADRRSYRWYASAQRYQDFETINVEFPDTAAAPPPDNHTGCRDEPDPNHRNHTKDT